MNEITPELKKERNIWKLATIIFGIIIVGLLISYAILNYENKTDICKIVLEKYGTPSWIFNNSVVQTGYIKLVNENGTIYSNEVLRDKLIRRNISLAYRDDCIWCKIQVDEMRQIGFWEEYKASGLTINCTK